MATPPIILSVAETGIDYTEVLEELVTKGIKYTKLEAVFNEASEDQVEQLLKIARRKFFGLKTRNNYLEDCHHLMLAGVAVRDASVTDMSVADFPNVVANDAGDVTASEGYVSALVTDLSNARNLSGAMDLSNTKDSSNAVDQSKAMDQPDERSSSPSNDRASSSTRHIDTDELIREADLLLESNGQGGDDSLKDYTEVLIEEANLMAEASTSTSSASATTPETPVTEEEPLTRIARGLKQAVALLLQREEAEDSSTEATKTGNSKQSVDEQTVTNDDSQDSSEYFTPGADPSTGNVNQRLRPNDPRAPTPSRSFTNISRIEKIVDPLDPLVFSNLKSTYSLIDTNEESMERRLDSDYIPCYSGRATSESEISAVAVDTYFTGTASSTTAYAARSGAVPNPSEDTVQRWTMGNSEVIIRKPSERRASVYARAKIRHTLVSDQDKQDASYDGTKTRNGTKTRKDTPQVSPSIPMNPETSASYGVWQRSFTPTNDLILTRPAIHQCDDGVLSDMVRRFETSATNTAAIEAPPPTQVEGQTTGRAVMPSRRSFLKPTSRPVSSSKSDYPPPHGCKIWRQFHDTSEQAVSSDTNPADN